MIRFSLVVAVVAWCGPSAPANPPAVIVPIQSYAVPAYGISYPDPAELAQAVRELASELKALREELARLKAGPEPLQLRDPSSLASKACSACHSPATAETKGGGLTLFDKSGGLSFPTDRDRQRASVRVRVGSMPPPPANLPAEDRKILIDLFTQKK